MNTDAMHRLADLMEVVEPQAFDMGAWWAPNEGNICGTAGCLCGWAVMTNDETKADYHRWTFMWDDTIRRELALKYAPDLTPLRVILAATGGFPFPDAGRVLLDLDRIEASRLFESDSWWMEKLVHLGLLNDGDDYDFGDLTSKQAAVVVRALANGEIDFAYDDEDENTDWGDE